MINIDKKRENLQTGEFEENKKASAFLKDLLRVCHKHDLGISFNYLKYQFVVEPLSKHVVDGLLDCCLSFKKENKPVKRKLKNETIDSVEKIEKKETVGSKSTPRYKFYKKQENKH
jgi:hypothetical protein